MKVTKRKRRNSVQDAAKVEARREQVSALLKGRMHYRQIASALGISLQTVHADVEALFAQWKERQIENTTEQKLLDLS